MTCEVFPDRFRLILILKPEKAESKLKPIWSWYLAVHVVVTDPAGGDTGRVPTLELTGTTGGRSAVHLIRTFAAVVLAVTHKVTGDAAAAGARELVQSARNVTWGGRKMKYLAWFPPYTI